MSDSKQYIANDIFSQILTTIERHQLKYDEYAKEYNIENKDFKKDIILLLKERMQKFLDLKPPLSSDDLIMKEYSKIIDPIKDHKKAHELGITLLRKFKVNSVLPLNFDKRREFLDAFKKLLDEQNVK